MNTTSAALQPILAGLDELISAGARFVTVSEFTAAVADGGLVVAVTFDDGDASVIDVAWPLLAARGLPATVFVLAERIGREGSLGADDLRTLAAAGWEIASHGAAHAFYPDLSEASIAADVRAGSAALAAITGTAPACFAFPFGGHDARVEQIVAR